MKFHYSTLMMLTQKLSCTTLHECLLAVEGSSFPPVGR